MGSEMCIRDSSWADKNVSGGLGIMLDDVFAGVATAASIALIQQSGVF